NWQKANVIISLIVIIIFATINITHAKNYKNKITFWSNAVVNSPSSSFNRNNLGAMYYLDGEYEKALRESEKTLELNPNEPLAHNNIGVIYEKLEQYAAAEQAYLNELQINPYYDITYFNLGLLYARMGNNAEATKYWHKTIELNPKHFKAYLKLAEYYLLNDDQETANQLLEEVVRRGGIVPDTLR
ncbi:MAG: tetratricopeptide repeat protein, partial [Candidatus Komeilibacteria bacterium]